MSSWFAQTERYGRRAQDRRRRAENPRANFAGFATSTAAAGDGNSDFGDGLSATALGNFMYDLVSALFNIHG